MDGVRIESQICYDLDFFERALNEKDKVIMSEYRMKTYKSIKNGLKIGKKVAYYRVYCLNNAGRYFWLINKHRKAYRYWDNAIMEGKRLGAKPDLARTYLEIGKRLFKDKNKKKEINGLNSEQYLEMARQIFEEIDLKWDLNEIDRIASHR